LLIKKFEPLIGTSNLTTFFIKKREMKDFSWTVNFLDMNESIEKSVMGSILERRY